MVSSSTTTTSSNSNTSVTNNKKTVLVFGSTGAVGTCLIEMLSTKQPTWTILAVSRNLGTSKFNHLKNVQVVQGDALQREDVLNLTSSQNVHVDIVYSCIGFPNYERKYWSNHWPIVVDNLLEGVSQQPNTKLVFCDNLYAYGATTNISSTTRKTSNAIVKPSFKSKPGVRATLWEKFEQHIECKGNTNPIVVVGGADFFGPNVTDTAFLGDTFTKVILSGEKAPIAIGSSSVVHDFCYVPDFANALYVASTRNEANNKFWICPHTIHNKTMSEIANDVARLSKGAKSPGIKVQTFPGWSVKMLSPFVGFLREMVEMLPYWSKDYSVVEDKQNEFCTTFNVKSTPYEHALQSYIDFYKETLKQEEGQKQK